MLIITLLYDDEADVHVLYCTVSLTSWLWSTERWDHYCFCSGNSKFRWSATSIKIYTAFATSGCQAQKLLKNPKFYSTTLRKRHRSLS